MKALIDLIFIMFSFIFIGNGCEQSTPTTPNPRVQSTYTNSFFPLDVGDYWIYTSIGAASGDTAKRTDIIDTKQFNGNIYFEITEKYYHGPSSWNDTLYLRFIDSNMLVKYINGKDSEYINFSLPVVASQVGPKYPGVLNDYPHSDSLYLGRLDSLKYIIFRSTEPLWSEFKNNIGEVESDYLFPKSLLKAKVGNSIYP